MRKNFERKLRKKHQKCVLNSQASPKHSWIGLNRNAVRHIVLWHGYQLLLFFDFFFLFAWRCTNFTQFKLLNRSRKAMNAMPCIENKRNIMIFRFVNLPQFSELNVEIVRRSENLFHFSKITEWLNVAKYSYLYRLNWLLSVVGILAWACSQNKEEEKKKAKNENRVYLLLLL